jgi:hypothetical protein
VVSATTLISYQTFTHFSFLSFIFLDGIVAANGGVQRVCVSFSPDHAVNKYAFKCDVAVGGNKLRFVGRAWPRQVGSITLSCFCQFNSLCIVCFVPFIPFVGRAWRRQALLITHVASYFLPSFVPYLNTHSFPSFFSFLSLTLTLHSFGLLFFFFP